MITFKAVITAETTRRASVGFFFISFFSFFRLVFSTSDLQRVMEILSVVWTRPCVSGCFSFWCQIQTSLAPCWDSPREPSALLMSVCLYTGKETKLSLSTYAACLTVLTVFKWQHSRCSSHSVSLHDMLISRFLSFSPFLWLLLHRAVIISLWQGLVPPTIR